MIAFSKTVASPCRARTLSTELDFGVALTGMHVPWDREKKERTPGDSCLLGLVSPRRPLAFRRLLIPIICRPLAVRPLIIVLLPFLVFWSSSRCRGDDPSGILNPGKTRKNMHTGFFEPYNLPKAWGQVSNKYIQHIYSYSTLSNYSKAQHSRGNEFANTIGTHQ